MSLDLACYLLNKKFPVACIACTCAGSLTHPFKNQQGRSWVVHLARDEAR
jgi:hypothetical protein